MALLNGRLPGNMLTALSWAPHRRMRSDAADALERLNAAFRAAWGHNLTINDGYRDYATQVDFRSRTQLPPSHPRYLRFASLPGTSEHGWGLAVDFGGLGGFDGAKYKWMQANAGRFGYYQPPQYQRGGRYPEPWHWEYNALRDIDNTPSEDEDVALSEDDRRTLRADMLEQANKSVRAEVPAAVRQALTDPAVLAAIAEAVLNAQVPEHPNLTGADARRVKYLLRDTRIQTRRIEDNL